MTMYRNPQAQAQILHGKQTPETTEIASRILNEGLPRALAGMSSEPTPPQMAPAGMAPAGMAPAGMAPAGMAQAGPVLPPPQDLQELDNINREELRGGWLLMNAEEPVPWQPGLTYGDFLNNLMEKHGKPAVDAFIDNQLDQDKRDKAPQPEPINPRQQQQRAALGAPPVPAPPAAPPAAPVAEQGGIMAAANGGLVSFAGGGLNMGQASQGAPVGEDEFMSVISQLSGEAGIPPDALEAVANVATETTGGGPNLPANDNVMDSGIMQNVEAVEATDEELTGIGSLEAMNTQLVEAGQEGLVHASPGELIFDPARLDEADQRMLLAALETAGIDPNSATVGNANNILNQMTGLPAFGFFSSIFKPFKKIGKAIGKGFKKVGKFLKRNAGTILGIAGAMTGNPWLAALGSGIGSLIEGKGIQASLISAGMSFVGTKWVGPWIGEQIGGAQGMFPSFGTKSVGEALGGIPGTGELGTSLAKTGAEALASKTAVVTAGKAAAQAVIDSAGKASGQALTDLATNAAKQSLIDSVVGTTGASLASTLGDTATNALSNQLASAAQSQIAGGVLSKGITSAAQFAVPEAGIGAILGTAPSFAVGDFGSRLLGTTVADTIGGAAAGAAQSFATSKIDELTSGIPTEDEQAALDAWNATYDYTPTSDELYTFYTNEFVPNRQVNVAQTIGQIPGYTSPGTGVTLAAGGGYMNGVGGPKSDSNLARLSNGEFVMTEAAVRGAGYGDRMTGAKRMYDIMNGLERRVA
jgi:hypothetical protein